MQESRLFKIVYYLLDQGPVTAAELAERFEVSVRTIYRDIDALSSAGIPVYTEAGRNGGIHLLSDFVLNQIVLSGQEKQEILSVLQGLSAVSGGCGTDMLEKLSALFHVHSVNWLEADFSRWGEKNRDNGKFEILKTAVLQRRCITIRYASSDGAVGERIIQPLKLYYKSKDWYLKAFCRLRQEFRLFKINRILEWELSEEVFEPVSFPELPDMRGQEYDNITLRFSKAAAYRVYDEFDLNQISIEENGDLTVTADMPEDHWLTGYLLSFGGQVEIIRPLHLKEKIAAMAKEIYEKNKT